jgi:hypothetical protein
MHWCPRLLAVQPHAPPTQVWPLPSAAQGAHTPELPQAVAEVPGWQVPFDAALQQPPLHAWVESHEVLHWPLTHAVPDGQSLAWLQPHWPAEHKWPVVAMVQSAQVPEVPHALPAVPAAHVPLLAAVQHPPLHGCVDEQEAVHWCVEVLQALLAGQSLGWLQPHTPVVRQALPVAWPVQSTHTVPVAPHWVWAVPGWQVPALFDEQHPLAHMVVDEQELMHRWVALLHELAPLAQSASTPQPHWPPPVTPSHLWPLLSLAQEEHRPPLLPHTPSAVPGWQVPPLAALQQPPLHGWVEPHAVSHWRVVLLHA